MILRSGVLGIFNSRTQTVNGKDMSTAKRTPMRTREMKPNRTGMALEHLGDLVLKVPSTYPSPDFGRGQAGSPSSSGADVHLADRARKLAREAVEGGPASPRPFLGQRRTFYEGRATLECWLPDRGRPPW